MIVQVDAEKFLKAINHEKKITGRVFRPIGINATGFPEKLTVATKDGKEAVYKIIGKKV